MLRIDCYQFLNIALKDNKDITTIIVSHEDFSLRLNKFESDESYEDWEKICKGKEGWVMGCVESFSVDGDTLYVNVDNKEDMNSAIQDYISGGWVINKDSKRTAEDLDYVLSYEYEGESFGVCKMKFKTLHEAMGMVDFFMSRNSPNLKVSMLELSTIKKFI